MKKSRIVIIALIAMMLLSTVVQAADNFAWVRLSKGKVWVKPAGSKYWFKPKIGMALKENDVIKTHKKSWITIAYENASLTRIGPRSEVKISKLAYDRTKKQLESKIKIFGLGKIISAVKKLTKGSSMEVETPTAVAGVRGTKLMVDVPNKNTTVVAVFEGKVIVKDFTTEAGLSKDDTTMMLDFLHEIALGEGQYSVYTARKGFKKSKPSGNKFPNSEKMLAQMEKESDTLLEKLKKSDDQKRQEETEALRKSALENPVK